MPNFSDRLTPAQIRLVLDALRIPWRENYNPENGGWANIPHPDFISDLSVNVFHGGWIDQYNARHPDPENDRPVQGDVVSLASWLLYESTDPRKGIKFIKEVAGINEGMNPPDIPEGFSFANDGLSNSETKFTRVPEDIWQSKISTSAKLVWIAIFSRINKGQIYSYAGIRNIAEQTKISNPTVQKAIKELEDAGLLLQKPARTGQRILRFPLVGSKEKINAKLQGEKATVQKIYTERIKNLYGTVQDSYTESDPTNQNHLIRTKIASKSDFIIRRFSEKYPDVEYKRFLPAIECNPCTIIRSQSFKSTHSNSMIRDRDYGNLIPVLDRVRRN